MDPARMRNSLFINRLRTNYSAKLGGLGSGLFRINDLWAETRRRTCIEDANCRSFIRLTRSFGPWCVACREPLGISDGMGQISFAGLSRHHYQLWSILLQVNIAINEFGRGRCWDKRLLDCSCGGTESYILVRCQVGLLAAAGLALSAVTHVTALPGVPGPLANWSWLLQVDIVACGLFAGPVANQMSVEFKRKHLGGQSFGAARAGCV